MKFGSILAVAMLLSVVAPASTAQTVPAETDRTGATTLYRGYRLDFSAIANDQNAGALRAAAMHQVDLVDAVMLKPDLKDFLHGLTIRVSSQSGRGQGRYVRGREVEIDLEPRADDRPILLHEMLHAVHALWLPGGIRNPDVLEFYSRAQSVGYPPSSYTMKNVKEYFAVTASIALHGHAKRPPFTRERLRERQPNYVEWLRRTLS